MDGLRVAALSGGTGGARFLRGLIDLLAADHSGSQLTVVGNTADDITLHGLHVSPDLDTIMYTLGGGIHETQGWGRDDDTFAVTDELSAYGAATTWFSLGDRDLATHLIRTQMLSAYSLSAVTMALQRRWLEGLEVPVRLLPMSDDRVETHVTVDHPEGGRRALHFQEWWVRYRATLPALQISLVGIEQASPAPGVLDAIFDADLVLLPPSNPVVSLGPILSVPGIREALAHTSAPVVGLSPIIAGRPVRGMADACLSAISVESSAAAVADLFQDVLDGWLVDEVDRNQLQLIESMGVPARAVPLTMNDRSSTVEMARQALQLVDLVRR